MRSGDVTNLSTRTRAKSSTWRPGSNLIDEDVTIERIHDVVMVEKIHDIISINLFHVPSSIKIFSQRWKKVLV